MRRRASILAQGLGRGGREGQSGTMGERQTRGQVTENPECPCEGLGLPPVNSGSHQSKGGGGREQGGGTDQRAVFQSRSPKESQEDSGMERRGLV